MPRPEVGGVGGGGSDEMCKFQLSGLAARRCHIQAANGFSRGAAIEAMLFLSMRLEYRISTLQCINYQKGKHKNT